MKDINNSPKEEHGYGPTHPWYYVLGGTPLSPKQILLNVAASGYQGYRSDEISTIANRPSKVRYVKAEELQHVVLQEFRKNVHRYRRVVHELYQYRRTEHADTEACKDVHVAVSLKHNHLYNDLAHVIRLEQILAQKQPSLFD